MPRGISKKIAQKKAEEAEAEAMRLRAIAEQMKAKAEIAKVKKEMQDIEFEFSNEDDKSSTSQQGRKNIAIPNTSSYSRVSVFLIELKKCPMRKVYFGR